VVSIIAGLSGVAKRSSVSADVAGALFDALLIIFVVLLVLGFTVYRPADPLIPATLLAGFKASVAANGDWPRVLA
jgi:uncharacterized membrane protein YtjA (UPF0391 family)